MTQQQLAELEGRNKDAAVIAIMADRAADATNEIKLLEAGDQVLISLPGGRTVENIEKYLNQPYRTKGERLVNDAASFLALVHRFAAPLLTAELLEATRGNSELAKGIDTTKLAALGNKLTPGTVVRLCLAKLYTQAVFNYPTFEATGWCDHGAKWQLKKHRDLEAWESKTGKWLSQIELMEFLEDHLQDITDKNKGPTQAVIAGVVADLEVNTEAKFQAKRDIHDGSYVLHSDSVKKPTVEVPKRFDIGVRIFDGLEIAYIVPVRLYFTTEDGTLKFRLTFTNLPQVLEEAWNGVSSTIKAGLPGHVLAINVPE